MTTALLLCLLAAPASAKDADWAALGHEAVRHTKELVRLDTSNPPGDELLAARYVSAALKAEGVDSKVLVSTGARASVVARLKGDGSKRPFLLICHTDVVPVERKDWTVDPFAAVEKDGYLYGRGAADMKSACGANLAVFLALKRAKVPLARDVILLGHADEESGEADRHAVWLTANHWAELDAEYGVNEGGFSYWKDGRVDAVDVQCAEKRYVDLKLVAKGLPGHASIPIPSNAVHALARAVARLSEWKPAYSVSPLAAATVRAGAAAGPEVLRAAAAGLEGPDPAGAAAEVAALSPELGTLLRDTCQATVLKGGYKSNVVPAEAEAAVNCRLLPGRDLDAFLAEVRAVIAEPGVEVRYLGPALERIPEMPFDDPFIAALKAALAEASPGAGVRPFLSPWSTDAEVFRSRGVKVYGVDPALGPRDKDRIHGNDERVPVAAVEEYAKLIYRLTLKVAGK